MEHGLNIKSGTEVFQESISKSPNEPLKVSANEPSREMSLMGRSLRKYKKKDPESLDSDPFMLGWSCV